MWQLIIVSVLTVSETNLPKDINIKMTFTFDDKITCEMAQEEIKTYPGYEIVKYCEEQ